MTWAQKRKFAYGLVFFFILFVLIGVPAYVMLYQKPTCFDGKQNGGEDGVDCGGPCVKLCSSVELQPVVLWQQTFKVRDAYTAVAYIENPNLDAEARSAPYTFTFYDASNTPITTYTNTTYIPAGKNITIVNAHVDMKGEVPVRTLFQFNPPLIWTRIPSNRPTVTVGDQLLSDASTTPTLTAVLTNSTFQNIPKVDATAVIYDTDGNAFAASKTFVQNLDGQTSQLIVFTWPSPFPVKEETCQAPTDVVLGIDRSGSMVNSLNAVKTAASAFVDNLKNEDKGALISFATTPTLDVGLTSNTNLLKSTIDKISINTHGPQETDIADTLSDAIQQLSNPQVDLGSKKTIVLLTDGVANYPVKKGDSTYPVSQAVEQAQRAKNAGIQIFTIGLGHDLDESFLKNIALDPTFYFNASTTQDVSAVYKKVAQSLCKKQGVRVEIIATIPPQ